MCRDGLNRVMLEGLTKSFLSSKTHESLQAGTNRLQHCSASDFALQWTC